MTANFTKQNIAIGALVLVYVSGILGLLSSKSEWFLSFTPANLILSLGIVLLFQKPRTSKLWLACALAYAIGFAFEVWGVNTGAIFGEYSYGATLGPKIWGTPLVIGINWVLLIVASASVTVRLLPKQNIFVKCLLAAALMTGLDFIIEPVAIQFDFWKWAAADIPLQNYWAWFAIAFAIHLLYFSLAKPRNNTVADVLFLLQIVFFAVLNFLG